MLNAEPLDPLPPASSSIPLSRTAEPPRIAAPVDHVLMTADAVGGVWQYAVALGRALASRGVRTTLAVMGPPPGANQRHDAERAGLAVIDRPYRLEWMDDPWEDVKRAGQWLLTLERTLRPSIVHLNGYSHAALPWSAPVVIVAHSCVRSWWRAVKNEEAPARLNTYRSAVAAGLRSARLVVAPTAAMLQALDAEYGVPIRSRVIPNGGGGMPRPAWSAKEPFVLSAGRAWDEAKNTQALCDIAGGLTWPVYVAGQTRAPDGRACRLEAVRSLGRVDGLELASWYRRAWLYALPARYEPFGLSVLEAAGAGCALVLGDIPSLRENWSDAAIFVAPGDRDALLDALQALISDSSRRRELGEAAWKRAAQFTIDRAADDYLRAYQDVMQ